MSPPLDLKIVALRQDPCATLAREFARIVGRLVIEAAEERCKLIQLVSVELILAHAV
jgi:hypothetical protein